MWSHRRHCARTLAEAEASAGPGVADDSAGADMVPESSNLPAGAESGADARYDQLFENLEELRCLVREDEAIQSDMFRSTLLGGHWQVHRTGRSVYGVRVDVRSNTLAASLCEAFGLNKSASFEHNVYGEEKASLLTRFWIHRMTSLVSCWEEAGARRQFSQEALQRYEVPDEVQAKWEEFHGRVLTRAKQIRSLAPR